MLDFLADLLGNLFSFMGAALPSSPFDNYLQVTQAMSTGLGWLNWMIPIGDMLTAMGLWIAAMVGVAAFNYVWRKTQKGIGGILNRNGGYTA